MEGEIKKARIDQKSTLFFISLFFPKYSGYKETQNTYFCKAIASNFLGQVLTIFQTGR